MEILINKDSKVVVKMEGGLGAQILSAGIYFYLHNIIGCDVYLDSVYFTYHKEHKRPVNNVNGLTLWPYQLDEFNLPLDGFKKFVDYDRVGNYIIIGDENSDNGNLLIQAFKNKLVRSKLSNYKNPVQLEEDFCSGHYACLHIRQGDYLAVSSHLVEDDKIIKIARSIAAVTDKMVVISDGEIPVDITQVLRENFSNLNYLIGGDPISAHFIMRNAKYLVCANSQFSLSAALLNEVYSQIFMPNKWFGDHIDPLHQKRMSNIALAFSSYSVMI